MAEMVKTPAPLPPTSAEPGASAWAPLREPLFRAMWIAAIISYIGTWMQAVGAGWMMTVLTMSPLMVGLVQAAVALPVFLVRSEEHTSELQSRENLVCRLLLEKKKKKHHRLRLYNT